MNKTKWIVFSLICVLALGGLIFVNKKNDGDKKTIDNKEIFSIIKGDENNIGDHAKGNEKAKLTVIEYGDFECPGCAGAQKTVGKIQETYKDKVTFVFRNFPLTSMHKNALAAAAVAEAAGLQGKYWPMHDMLYDERTGWVNTDADQRNDTFNEFAKKLGLDVNKFKEDLSNPKIKKKIDTDMELAKKSEVPGTPSFIVGKERADSKVTNDVIQSNGSQLMDMIDKSLKELGEIPPKR